MVCEPSASESATYNVPTGLVGVAPPGPEIPVSAKANVDPNRKRAPSAI